MREAYGFDVVCAKVGVFRAGLPLRDSAQSSCTFGLSPEFSTPVEKTVEIPHETLNLRPSSGRNRAKRAIFGSAKIHRNRAILNQNERLGGDPRAG
jgi:hypothetical protein